MHTDIQVLDSLVAIHLEVNIWTARRKLSPADFGGAVLPPGELASLGSKRVCDPEDLRVFGTLKARAVSLLERTGVRFLGGWAIPEDKAEAVHQELETIGQEFEAAKEAFLGRYDEAVRQWIARHARWERIIADSTVGVEQVRSRMGFRWQAYRVVAPSPGDAVASGLHQEVSGLGGTLFGETAKAAAEAWHKCYAGKTSVTRKALSPLRTIHHKLAGLAFVEPRVAPVAELMDTAFQSLPRRGRIQGAPLLMLQGLVCLLRDTSALLEHGQKLMDGTTPGDVLQALTALRADHGPVIDDPPDTRRSQDEFPLAGIPVPLCPALPSQGLW